MSHISADENDWLCKNPWSHVWDQNIIYSSKLYIDFETQIRKRLSRCFGNVFDLNTLGSDTEQSIAYAFNFGVDRRFSRQNNDN